MTHRDPGTRSGLAAYGLVGFLAGVLIGGAVLVVDRAGGTPDSQQPPTGTVAAPGSSPTSEGGSPDGTVAEPTTTTGDSTTSSSEPPNGEGVRPRGVVPLSTVGQPWGSTEGLTMFRGNPTRSWYGTGPLPDTAPAIDWRYPRSGGLCGQSSNLGETKTWCGTGWTGQPVVWERPDGVTELIVGTYDGAVHFLDADTGEPTRQPFPTGDLIKGTVTLDPDGYPLLYFGSRDNKFRILALDRDPVVELWSLDAEAVDGIWNDDWDANPVVVDDILYEGGENGWFFAIKLNRQERSDGLATVDPERIFEMPGWNQELTDRVGTNVSIENSPLVVEDRVYFANSGGRLVGLDVSRIEEGEAPIVLDYWLGDDTDATLVADDEGMIYAAVEYERFNERAKQVGQLVKLDPSRPEDPRVWGIDSRAADGTDAGLWATPAVHDGVVYAATQLGQLWAVDADSGEITWEDDVGWHAWSSPVVVDGVLLQATCSGELRAYDLTDPRQPEPLWTTSLSESCIESTPAVWEGRIYVGSRDGGIYALGG